MRIAASCREKRAHPSEYTTSFAADQFQTIGVLLLRHQAAASAERKERKRRVAAVRIEGSGRYTPGFLSKVTKRTSFACVVLKLVYVFLSLGIWHLLKSCVDLPPQFLCQDTLGEEEGLCDVNCGGRGAVVFPRAIAHCLAVTSPAEDPAAALIDVSQRASLEVSCPCKAKAVDMEKDLHGSAFHQGLNELQEVSGDDREGIPHEQLQVSHNLDETSHSQTKQNVMYLVTKYCAAESLGRVIPSLFYVLGRDIFLLPDVPLAWKLKMQLLYREVFTQAAVKYLLPERKSAGMNRIGY
ncbi:hypothetical protein QYF61_002258 [Mycteria americana]|uniref:Uncharacterized protein n=1 Tax=Mycteria americana TaxID=33587 RepID=A0AAN7NB17_MYCAM|nr:hypothetical protein QYF61_002258 [Mycteria americana]